MANSNFLPHVRNSQAANNAWEPVVGSQFAVYLMPPSGVSDATILTEHVRKIDGFFVEKQANVIQRNFQTQVINYDSNDKQNGGEFTISFQLFLNDANDNYVRRILKEWFRKKYNPITGERGLKKDYIGQVTCVRYNRDGSIYQQRTASFCFPSSDIPDMPADYSSNEGVDMDITFTADIIEDDGDA